MATHRAWGKTHGGWRTGIDWVGRTSIEMHSHDQLARSESFRLDGGVAYSLTGSMDVNVGGFVTASGKNEVTSRGVGVGFTWSASPAQLIKKKRGPESPQ